MTLPAVLVQAAAGPAWERSLAALREHLPPGAELVVLDGPAAAAAGAAAPADVVLVEAPVIVGAGWLEALDAARETTAATVSPIVIEGGPPPEAESEPAAGARHPRLPEPSPACRLVRRAALQLAGPLDEGFAARCSARGLTHLLAGDVIATLPAATGPGLDPEDRSGRHERPPGAHERARLRALRRQGGLSVTIDGRALGSGTAGTQVQTLELLRALHAQGGARLRVVLPPDPGEAARRALAEMPGTEVLDGSEVPRGTPRTHVVHRPYQVTSADDLVVLRRLGHRTVVTHQDSILYHAAGHHADAERWGDYRRLTAEAASAADLIVTYSQHAADDLVADDLVDPARVRVVPLGADHASPGTTAPREPTGLAALQGRPFVLCIGTDLRHKNRPFAIELVAELRRGGWDGGLVLAGPHLEPGGSAAEERELLAARPDLAGHVLDLGPVDDAARAWLYGHASAVAYPTVVEGFGLVPFEAASAGTPSLFAHQASLAELLPADAAVLVPWDVVASAERVRALLEDEGAARAQVEAVRAAAQRLTWASTARRLLEVYDEALALPSPPGAAAAWRALEAEEARGAAEGRYWELRDQIGPAGLALVGPDGALPEDVRRGLAAITGRAATRRPLFALVRAMKRAAGRH